MKNIVKILALFLLIVCSQSCVNNENKKEAIADDNTPEKELYIPAKIYMVPDSNDYTNDTSAYSFKHSVQTNNIALFWHKEYGDDPMANPDTTRRFDPNYAIEECERFYNYYVNELKLVEKGNSLADKYKLLIIVFGGDGGTAFGGGEEEKIGMLWTPAVRINKTPYGALAHEMAHSFQYLSNADCGKGPRGAIMEMSAQYMLWQVYPEWMTFENYHLVDFMKGTHYAFLHGKNMYHSPYVLEYWSEKHGKDFFGKLMRNTEEGEDPVATYKRLNTLSQEDFNDEIFDASRKFITWDLERVEEVANQYANQHYCTLVEEDNWYRIDSSNCPQNYGYNGIKLDVPEAGKEVTLEFKGLAGAEGYTAVNVDKAGWRYGFLAYLENGKRVYGEMHNDPEGKVSFKVPKKTEYLWLVVSGAPAEHWPIVMRWGRNAEKVDEEQWPYQVKFTGTQPEKSFIKKI